jgi:F0F1-type ATP synthase assembly protein I
MNRSSSQWLVFLGSGFELLGVMIGAIWLGPLLDEHFDTKPLFLLLLMGVGFCSWLFHFIVLLRRVQAHGQGDQNHEG